MTKKSSIKTSWDRKCARLATALLTLLSPMFVSGAAAQTQLQKYLPGATPEGAVYFLPKTAVRISVLIEKSTFQPGDFCRYAQKYLRLSDAGQEPWVSHRVLSITQTPVGVADTSKAYALKFDPRTVAVNVRLSDDGCLQGINTPLSPSEGGKGLGPSDRKKGNQVGTTSAQRGREGFQYLTEEILAAGSTAKMAELTAREIYDIRENRSLLVKGQADFMPKDGRQLELMLQQLDTQDRALTALFAGTLVCDTTEEVIIVTPDAPCERQLLFRLSQTLGVVDVDDLSGEPFYISIDDMHSMPPVDSVAAAKVKKKTYEAGVYVNIPGRLRTTIYQGINQLQTAEFPAPQFGHVELLSGDLFNKRYTTRLWLSPLTGAVERLEADIPK